MKAHSSFVKRRNNFHVFKFLAASAIWGENRSKSLQYFFEILSNIQLIAAILYTPCLFNLSFSENSATNLFRDIVQSISLIEKLPNAERYLLTDIFIFICAYFILFFCLLIYTGSQYFQRKRLSRFPHTLLTYWAQLHHTLLFWIFNLFLMSICTNNPLTKISVFGLSDRSIPIKVVSIFLIALNNMLGASGAIFCYDPFMTNNPFASYNSTFQRLTFLHKAIIGPVIVFITDTEILKWFAVIVNLGLALIRKEQLYYQLPYYKYPAMRLTSLLAGKAFCLTFVHLIAAILDKFDLITSTDVIFLEIAMAILFVKLSLSRLKLVIRKYISIPEEKLLTQKDIFKKIFALADLLRGTNFMLSSDQNRICNQYMTYLMGNLSTHTNKCDPGSCLCQYVLSDKQKNNNSGGLLEIHKVNDQLQPKITLDVLNRGIKGFKNNNIFKIIYAYILLKHQRKLTQAFFTIFNIGRKFRTFSETVLIYYLKKQLEDDIIASSQISPNFNKDKLNNDENAENSLGIKQAVDTEKRSDTLFMLIEKNTQAYVDLWSYFLKSNVYFHQFMMKSKAVENNALEIDMVWNKISKEYDHISPYIYGLYCTYLTLVRNMPSKAEKLFMKCYSKQQKYNNHADDTISDLNLEDNCDVIFYISMSKDTLGRVLHTSRNIYEELGWSQAEVIDRNIKTIQPPFIKDKHDQILLHHMDRSHKLTSMVSNFDGFVYDKKGYTVPIQANVTIFPYIEKQPIYAGIIRKKSLLHEVLVIAPNGIVEAFSETIFKDLNILPNQTVHLGDICRNFEQVKQRLEYSFKGKEFAPSINKAVNANTQLIMAFGPITSQFSLFRKEVTYTVKIEKFAILDESFLCLYLYDKRKYDMPLNMSHDKADKVRMEPDNTMHEITEMIPEEFAEADNKDDTIKKSDCALFTVSAIGKSGAYHKSNSQTLTKNVIDFVETQAQMNIDKGKSAKDLNNTISELLVPKESFSSPKKRFLERTKKNNFMNELQIGADSVSRSSSIKALVHVRNKLEEAVYVLPRERYSKILDYLITMFAIACVSLICFHMINSHYKFALNLEKIELIVISQRRSLALSNVATYVRLLDFITKGVLSDTRHISTGTVSWRVSIKASTLYNANLLNFYNSQLFNSLYLLDKSAQEKIYSNQVTVIRPDSVKTDQEVDAFRVLTDIANTALKVSQMNPATVSTALLEVKFVLDNSLNGPLVASEEIINVVINDCKQDLYEIRDIAIILLIVTVSFGAFILLLLLIDVKKFINKRNLLIEILFRMNEDMVYNHLKIVARFQQCLSSSMFNPNTYIEIKGKLPDAFEPKIMKKRGQYISKRGINAKIIQGLLFTGATVIVFASVFVVVALNFETNLQQFLWKIDRMVLTCSFRINLNLLHLGVLEYIGENNSTLIRGRPVEEQMNYYFDQTRMIPNLVNQILMDTKGINSTLLETLFEGNMCSVIKVPSYPDFFCNYIGDIIGAKGLVRMASYLVQGYQESKDMYDASNHTIKDAFIASSTKKKILGEEIAAYPLRAVEIVEDLFKEDLRQSVQNYEDNTILIVFGYILVYVFLAFILSFKVWKNMKNERGSWRKIIRQIPFSIVSSNKLLKAYLVRNCDNMLDSFKNSI